MKWTSRQHSAQPLLSASLRQFFIRLRIGAAHVAGIFGAKGDYIMAKPLGPKSILIREAIKNNPDLGNTEIATLINGSEDRKSDKIKVKPGDIAQQKQAMKKAGKAAPTPRVATKAAGKNGGEAGSGRQAAAKPPPAAVQPVAQAGPVDLIDKTIDLAQQCGGVAALKRLVDRLADMQKW
jgi:hypothetical protein